MTTPQALTVWIYLQKRYDKFLIDMADRYQSEDGKLSEACVQDLSFFSPRMAMSRRVTPGAV